MARWVNITSWGDDWEVELDVQSRQYRYRPFAMRQPRQSFGSRLEGVWQAGRPPTGKHKGG